MNSKRRQEKEQTNPQASRGLDMGHRYHYGDQNDDHPLHIVLATAVPYVFLWHFSIARRRPETETMVRAIFGSALPQTRVAVHFGAGAAAAFLRTRVS